MRHKCEKNTKKCEKVAQDLPKRCPIRWSQILGFFQVASKLRPRGPRGAQEAPKTPQERPKSTPRAAQSAPNPPKSAQKAAQIDPRVTEICPRDAQCTSRGTFFVLFFDFFCFVAFFYFFLAFAAFFYSCLFLCTFCELMSRDRGFGGELPIVVSPLPAGWTLPSREPYGAPGVAAHT